MAADPKKIRIILASSSPRRQQFLRELGLDFEIRVREIDEVFPDDLKAGDITAYLARLKADAFPDLADHEVLVTSDTIVWHDGRALGKPTGYEDAFRMLRELSGATHEVFTSVCLTKNGVQDCFTERTAVTFAPVEDAIIEQYLRNFEPYDKAGSYGIQDWFGLIAISRIEGSYTNVVGLPTERFFRHLLRLL